MRISFIKTLAELADRDARIVLLTADLGYMALEPFVEKFPDRFFNVGVGEQNMVGVATGLAEAGFLPFVYSIAPFAALRPYEFIRNGPILHHLQVRVVGVGGGIEYSHNGVTHYGLEDVAVMRVQPGITVVAPGDYQQTRAALLASWDLAGPIYYRLGKDDKTSVPGLEGHFALGRAEVLKEGTDILIVTMGSIAGEVVGAAKILAEQGVSACVLLVSSFNPAPVEDLIDHLDRFQQVITAEAHYPSGGVGSLVCEVAAERGARCRVTRCSIESCNDGITGSQQFFYDRHGLSGKAIAATALRALRGTVAT